MSRCCALHCLFAPRGQHVRNIPRDGPSPPLGELHDLGFGMDLDMNFPEAVPESFTLKSIFTQAGTPQVSRHALVPSAQFLSAFGGPTTLPGTWLVAPVVAMGTPQVTQAAFPLLIELFFCCALYYWCCAPLQIPSRRPLSLSTLRGSSTSLGAPLALQGRLCEQGLQPQTMALEWCMREAWLWLKNVTIRP